MKHWCTVQAVCKILESVILNSKKHKFTKEGRLGFRFLASNFCFWFLSTQHTSTGKEDLIPQCICSSDARQHRLFLKRLLRESCLCVSDKTPYLRALHSTLYFREGKSSEGPPRSLIILLCFRRVCGGTPDFSCVWVVLSSCGQL